MNWSRGGDTLRICRNRPVTVPRIVALLFCWLGIAGPTTAATFENVAETGSPYPGGGTFNAVSNGAIEDIEDGVAYFFGRAASNTRLSLLSTPVGGMPSVLVDPSMPVPDGTGTFYDLTTVSVSVSGGNLLFSNRSQNNLDFGIYRRDASGSILRIADRTMNLPGSSSTFTFFYDLEQVGAANSYFLASGNGGQNGVYLAEAGSISTIIDKTTPVPGQGSPLFTSIDSFDIEAGRMTFAGSTGSYRGVFTTVDEGQSIQVVADNQTPMPNYTAWNFDFLGNPQTNGEDVVFYGRSAKDPNNGNFRMEGIYGYVDGALQMLADLTTLNPRGGVVGAGGGFGKIDALSSFDGDLFTFSAEHDGEANGDADGIYFGRLGGDLQLLVEETQTVNGGKVIEDVGGSLVSGNRISFGVLFDDNTSAIYAARVPLLPGDYNDDGFVNAADYTIWRNSLGQETALPNEDDTPGAVTDEDYAVWKAHFGESTGSGSGAAGAHSVPESASVMLMGLGSPMIVSFAGRTRRRSRTSPRPACCLKNFVSVAVSQL
jgi:hypothetical protein